ncbi:uncharacterized protein LOC111049534 [Nilaparvata lugens]|uniref:uncharacterized protein LOC111049534 n=1 Tax=Nilaparvata lugens TaxID=108931 RepID=UPI00193C87A6|nr:uncharacterized protein LOC111049534 [Nilaparvata lugens]
MSSNRDFVISVIEMYRDHTCLWKITDPGYHDKVKRNAALEMILEFFKTVDPTATKDVVTKKLNSMRGSFRKEMNKVRASQRSGTGADDVHIPKLWYFDRLQFLEDQEFPRPSTTIASVLDDMPFEYDETDVDDPAETQSQTSSSSSRPQTPVSNNFKRPRTKADQVLDKISKRMDQPPEKRLPKEKFSSFGEHVAEKLRYMPPEMVPICQKLISDCIFQGDMKNLNITSRIVTDYVNVMSQPSTSQPISSDPSLRGETTQLLHNAFYDAMNSVNDND